MKMAWVMAVVACLVFSTVGCWEPKKYDEGKKVLTDVEAAKGLSTPSERAGRLAELSVQQNNLMKDFLGARDSITLAVKAAGEVEDSIERVVTFSKVGGCQVQLGRISNAQVSMKEAKVASAKLPENLEPERKAELFLGMATVWSQMAVVEETQAALEVVLQMVEKMASEASKLDTLIEVTGCYIRVKDDEHRDAMFKRLEALATAQGDPRETCNVFNKMAGLQFGAKLAEMGEATLKKAEEAIEKIDVEGNQAISLCDVAEIRVKYCGKVGKKEAKKLVRRADKLAKKELDSTLQTQAAEKIMKLKSKLGMK